MLPVPYVCPHIVTCLQPLVQNNQTSLSNADNTNPVSTNHNGTVCVRV